MIIFNKIKMRFYLLSAWLFGDKDFAKHKQRPLWCLKCGKDFISHLIANEDFERYCDVCNRKRMGIKIKYKEYIASFEGKPVAKVWLSKQMIESKNFNERFTYEKTGLEKEE